MEGVPAHQVVSRNTKAPYLKKQYDKLEFFISFILHLIQLKSVLFTEVNSTKLDFVIV